MLLSCHARALEWIYTLTCLNVKELLSGSRPHIWSSTESNGIRTNNYLVLKRTLNNLVKLAKRLSCVVSTYLYGAFDCMLLSCHLQIIDWIYTLYLPECQGTPCSKQELYLKFKWQQQNSNPQPQNVFHPFRILLSFLLHLALWIARSKFLLQW